MTDYGRGSGSEPWHPEDPLFGDVSDQGQGHQQPPQYAQQQPGGPQDPQSFQQGQGHPQEPGAGPLRPAPGNTGSWNPDEEDNPREHAFFAGRDDDDEDDGTPSSTPGRRGGASQPKGKKRR